MTNSFDPNYVPTKSYALVGQKAIVLNAGKILILHREEKPGVESLWSLPGGGLDDGENPFEGIMREITEETQLRVTDLKPYFLKSYKNKNNDFCVIVGYTCKADTPEKIKLNWEHSEFKWLSKDEAIKLNLTPDARTFLENFSED